MPIRWFNRSGPEYPALRALLESDDPTDRAIAQNFRCDSVSIEREADFERFLPDPCDAEQFKRAVTDYFEEKIRSRALPQYVYRAKNSNNILTGGGRTPAINTDVKLVRVLDLNSSSRLFNVAKLEDARAFATFPSGHDPRLVSAWLDNQLSERSDSEVVAFLGSVLEVLNDSRSFPFNPIWTTTWNAFADHSVDRPERWLEIMGVPKPAKHWLVQLRYTVSEAGTIARPTQLDAGWFPYYFPSPPQASDLAGTHPMDLRTSPQSDRLLPTYIHKQIHHTIDHIVRIGRTTDPVIGNLETQRRCHRDLLARVYGANVFKWMPNVL